jgi:hypothetical protein
MDPASLSRRAILKSLIATAAANAIDPSLLIAASQPSDFRPLGSMTGFYRYTAILGPQLSPGTGLRTIPPWMAETDFPYQKRPFDKEAPFADGLSTVRLLGGWADNSLPTDSSAVKTT